MITNYESFVNAPNFLELSEGMQAKIGKHDFANLFESSLFESETDTMLLEKAYGTYELGLLYENRKSWFENDTPIYMLDGEGHKILFKENSMFIITNQTYDILNEGWFDDTLNWVKNKVAPAITYVKNAAVAAVKTVASTAKNTWDALSDGAKKVYAFGKRIVSAAAAFAKSDPLEATAMALSILSILLSFFPPIAVWVNPILICVSGALEIYAGSKHIVEAYHKLKDITPSDLKGSATHFAAGAPLLIAGSISMLFGTHDIMTSPLAGTGAGPIASVGGKKVAAKWGETFAGQMVHNFEHFMEHNVSKVTSKMGESLASGFGKMVGEKVAENGPAIINLILVSIGRHILGGAWNGVVKGLSTVSKGFSFLLGIPTKIGEAIANFKKSAESTGAKIIASALDSFVGPAMRGVGSFIDKHIKPRIDGIKDWFESLSVNYKELEKISEEKDTESEKIEIQPRQIKPKNAEVEKKDDKAIKELPKVTDNVKEGLLHIRGFEEFSIV